MSALEVQHLSFRYPRREGRALRSVSFVAPDSRVIALLGPNGCGKSTLLRLLAGILPLDGPGTEGGARLDGKDLAREPQAWRARRIAYLGSDFRSEFPITVRDAVMLGRASFGAGLLRRLTDEDRARAKTAMARAQCADLADRDLATLSGGERQLAAIARALAQASRILLLDESLSQMDLDHQAGIGRLLRELAAEGHTVILVSHDVNLASRWADLCLLLKKGDLIAAGPLQDVLTEDRLRALYPGADLFVAPHPRTGTPRVFFG